MTDNLDEIADQNNPSYNNPQPNKHGKITRFTAAKRTINASQGGRKLKKVINLAPIKVKEV